MLPANSVRRTDGYLLTVPVTRIVKERVSLILHDNLHRCCAAATLEDSIWSYSTFQMHIQESSQCPVNKHSQHKSKASVFPVKCSLKEWTNKMHNYCRRTHTHLTTILAPRHRKYRLSKKTSKPLAKRQSKCLSEEDARLQQRGKHKMPLLLSHSPGK